MINPVQFKLYRNFTPLQIVTDVTKREKFSSYKIIKNNDIVGTFLFSEEGQIECLKIKEKYRRTKTSGQALLSVFDFCKKKGEEKGLDCLFCYGEKSNPNLVCKLYGKVGVAFDELVMERFIIPLNEKGEQYIKKLKDLLSEKGLLAIIEQAEMIMKIN